jgi:hypothetical protein
MAKTILWLVTIILKLSMDIKFFFRLALGITPISPSPGIPGAGT